MAKFPDHRGHEMESKNDVDNADNDTDVDQKSQKNIKVWKYGVFFTNDWSYDTFE